MAEYAIALKNFEDVLTSPDASPDDRLMAIYGKAVTWDLRQPIPSQNDELAATLYQQIIDQAPGHDLAGWSALALARMVHLVPVDQETDYPHVRAAYQRVIEQYPDHPAAHEALIYQQSTLIMTLADQPTREAVDRLNAFIQDHPSTRFASAAWNLIANGYETLGDYDQVLDARIRELASVEIDPDNPALSDLSWRYWQIATTAEFKAGRFDIARTYYRKLIDEYPLDFRKFPSRQAIARMDRMEQALDAEARP